MFSKKQQKWIILLLSAMILIFGTFAFVLAKACFYNPYHVETDFLTLSSSQIPSSMDQVSAVYITDLEYSDETGTQTLDAVFEEIQKLSPDLFFFGGDLYASAAQCTDENRAMLSEKLAAIKAPLGKFAVYGEQDLIDENRRAIVADVYANAQIELLSNASVLLTNRDREGIRLYGAGIDADPAAMLASAPSAGYSLLLSHYPDNLPLIAQAGLLPSQAFCGNSHGTQIELPLLGGYRKFPGSIQINRADTPSVGFRYLISSGIGCIEVPARLNAPVQILYITFASR